MLGQGAAVTQLDPSALFELSGPAYAAASFAVLLAAAATFLARREAAVDRAVDHAVGGSPLAVVYGVIPFGAVAFVGGYVLSESARVGVATRLLVVVLMIAVVVATTAFAGLGYLIVGAYVTELEGRRRLRTGAVVGAAIGAVPWIALPPGPALAVWVGVAAVGLGGTTREWVHGERTVETEAGE